MSKIFKNSGFRSSSVIGSLAVLVVLLSVSVNTKSYKDRELLIQNVFYTETNYFTWNYPSNLTVQLGLSLISLNAKRHENSLHSTVLLRQLWFDPRFRWNPAEYGGEREISILPGKMLKPDIKLLNSVAPPSIEPCAQTKLRVSNDGQILWVTPCQFDSVCDFGTYSPDYNSSEFVTCPLKFGTWAEDGFLQDIQLYKNKPEVDLDFLEYGTEFHVRGSSAQRVEKIVKDGFGEIFPASLKFEITLQEIRSGGSPSLGGNVGHDGGSSAEGNPGAPSFCAPGHKRAPDGTCQEIADL